MHYNYPRSFLKTNPPPQSLWNRFLTHCSGSITFIWDFCEGIFIDGFQVPINPTFLFLFSFTQESDHIGYSKSNIIPINCHISGIDWFLFSLRPFSYDITPSGVIIDVLNAPKLSKIMYTCPISCSPLERVCREYSA